jgi:multidrug resistance efflux pump
MQVMSKRSEIESALRDLDIELAEKDYAYEVARIEAAVDAGILSRREHGERQLAFQRATRELSDTRARVASTREKGDADLDVLIIARDKLQQDLTSAQQDLALLSIKAPSAGLVIYEERTRSTARYQPGDSCWPGQTIIRIPDLSVMQVSFLVNEVDARHLEVGMPVAITMDSFPDRPLRGVITQIPSMAVIRGENSQVKVFKVVSSLSETWSGDMKPGMSVLGRVVVDRRDDVPMLARRVVRFDGRDYWLAAGAAGGDPDSAPRKVHPVARNATYYVLDTEADAAIVEALGLAPGAQPAVAAAGGRP